MLQLELKSLTLVWSDLPNPCWHIADPSPISYLYVIRARFLIKLKINFKKLTRHQVNISLIKICNSLMPCLAYLLIIRVRICGKMHVLLKFTRNNFNYKYRRFVMCRFQC